MNVKLIFATALALMTITGASAQQALKFRSAVTSPEINPDHSVTFRYYNPKAVTVQLQGEMLSANYPVDMKEGSDGIWTYTTEPLEGELDL